MGQVLGFSHCRESLLLFCSLCFHHRHIFQLSIFSHKLLRAWRVSLLSPPLPAYSPFLSAAAPTFDKHMADWMDPVRSLVLVLSLLLLPPIDFYRCCCVREGFAGRHVRYTSPHLSRKASVMLCVSVMSLSQCPAHVLCSQITVLHEILHACMHTVHVQKRRTGCIRRSACG